MLFKTFCIHFLDHMWTNGMKEEEQCSGYHLLKKMVKEQIEPASLEEIERYLSKPTMPNTQKPRCYCKKIGKNCWRFMTSPLNIGKAWEQPIRLSRPLAPYATGRSDPRAVFPGMACCIWCSSYQNVHKKTGARPRWLREWNLKMVSKW